MTQFFSESIREWLGWCPKHVKPVEQPVKMGPGFYIVAAFCVLLMAAGIPLLSSPASQDVMVWAFQVDESGFHDFVTAFPATEDASGRLSFPVTGTGAPVLPAGKYWLVIEHPDENGSFLLTLDGSDVKSRSPDSTDSTVMLFMISGPGSLRGEDAYEMLLAALNSGSPFEEMVDRSGNTPAVFVEREYIVE